MKRDLRVQVNHSELKSYTPITNEPLKKKSNNDLRQKVSSPSMSQIKQEVKRDVRAKKKSQQFVPSV